MKAIYIALKWDWIGSWRIRLTIGANIDGYLQVFLTDKAADLQYNS